MIKLLQLLTLIFYSYFLQAQIIAPNFYFTDTQGNNHNLYTELSLGKPVVLSFFGTTCGTCMSNVPALENIWQTYGNNGQDLWVWGIEAAYANNNEVDSFLVNYGGTYPAFATQSLDTVISLYNITYTPQTFFVCTDQTMKPLDLSDPYTMIDACLNYTSTNDFYSNSTKIISVHSGNNPLIKLFVQNPKITEVQIYDILGNKLNTISGTFLQGQNSVQLNGILTKSGYFFIRLIEGQRIIETQKISFMK